MPILIRLVDVILATFQYLLIAHIILSWIPQTSPIIIKINAVINSIILPVLNPLRRIVPVIDIGGVGLDLTALVALIILQVLRGFLHSLLINLLVVLS